MFFLLVNYLRRVEPTKSEPFGLVEEIDRVLAASATPPYSENDL
jgi:hypothetical protein